MNLGGGSHPNYFSCLNVFSVLDPWICQPVCLQNYDCMTVKVVKSSINVSNFSYKSCTLLWYAREEESFTRNNSVYFHKKNSQAYLIWAPKLDMPKVGIKLSKQT